MKLTLFNQNRMAYLLGPRGVVLLLGSFLLLVSSGQIFSQEVPGGCGSLRESGRFGPFDYRPDRYIPEPTFRSHAALLKIVEEAHFTPAIETLVRGRNNPTPGGDLSYTLHAFPNHHRALISMIALGEKEKTNKPVGSTYYVECWLSRAIAWRPDDNIVRMIYAQYLAKLKREKEAEQQLDAAASQAGDNAFTHQNIGLIYFDMKNYQKALLHAHKAYALGLGVPTLREQLKSVGQWSEATEAPPAEPSKKPQ